MDDAADVNKVVAAIFAAHLCSGQDIKHANYLAEYEVFLALLEARDGRARDAAVSRAGPFTQIGGKEEAEVAHKGDSKKGPPGV